MRLTSTNAAKTLASLALAAFGVWIIFGRLPLIAPLAGIDPIISIRADLSKSTTTHRPTRTTAATSAALDDPALVWECERTLTRIGPELKPLDGAIELMPSSRLFVQFHSGRQLYVYGDLCGTVIVDGWIRSGRLRNDVEPFIRAWEKLTGDVVARCN